MHRRIIIRGEKASNVGSASLDCSLHHVMQSAFLIPLSPAGQFSAMLALSFQGNAYVNTVDKILSAIKQLMSEIYCCCLVPEILAFSCLRDQDSDGINTGNNFFFGCLFMLLTINDWVNDQLTTFNKTNLANVICLQTTGVMVAANGPLYTCVDIPFKFSHFHARHFTH